MDHWVEIEVVDDAKRVKYYYKCPKCGHRVNDLTLSIRKRDGSLVITKEEYSWVPAKSRVGTTKKTMIRNENTFSS